MSKSMKALAVLVVVAAMLTACSESSNNGSTTSTFSKSYGGPLEDSATVVLNSDDGGFMLFGSAEGDATIEYDDPLLRGFATDDSGDFWLQKLDTNGNVEHSRMIGVRSPLTEGTTWIRARPTPDGGVILIGWYAIGRPSGFNARVTVSADIAVTKLDAGGGTVWRVTHDSGAWLNYDYFTARGWDAAARDFAEDVWPTEDGGFVVVGTSVANLEDRFSLGFPCFDAELDEISDPCEGIPPNGGNRFVDAASTIVLRLNADGSLRWRRRLTDNAFDSEANGRRNGLLSVNVIRGIADDEAVVARWVDGGMMVYRLRADGSVGWRSVVGTPVGLAQVTDEGLYPTVLIQTDDATDGPDGDQYDGLRDDGFVLAAYGERSSGRHPPRIIKLDAQGALQWNVELELDELFSRPVPVDDLTQHCDYGRPTRCDILVVGSARYVAFLDEDGDVRAHAEPPHGIRRIAPAGANRFRLLGLSAGSPILSDLDVGSPEPAFSNTRYQEDLDLRGVVELRPDGGALLFIGKGDRLAFFDSQAQLESELDLASELDSDVLRTAVQIRPGSFVLAGTRSAQGGQSGIVALRYDLDGNDGRVVWQRRLVDDAGGAVLEAVPSGDGGAVLSVFASIDFENMGPDDPQANVRTGHLLKLDADGRLQWRTELPDPSSELLRMPDGSLVALTSLLDGSQTRVLHLSAAGEVQRQSTVSLDEIQGEREAVTATAMTVTSEAGVVLAGSRGRDIALVRLAANGELASAVNLEMPRFGVASAYFKDLHVRQAGDGGFVLALTETGMDVAGAADENPQPRGQSNVLVLKVDAAFQPVWSHIYGGLFADGVRDLALRPDGTIAVAGYSDSLGERREAWLLKLAPSGLINGGGCPALLATIPAAFISATPGGATVVVERATAFQARDLPPFEDTHALVYEFPEVVTARQCLGDASAGVPDASPVARQHLTVVQAGSLEGVVTSAPRGISCGTGLNMCAADFARGTRVALRADADDFRGWRSACDEGTGGTSLDCVVLLDRDRTIEVEFGPRPPPPPARHVLSFAVQGAGSVRTDDGIDCTEGASASACSREYESGTVVDARAVPAPDSMLLGWSGETQESPCRAFGRQLEIQITVDQNLRCFAQFGPDTNLFRRLSVVVFGAGLVQEDPPAGAFNCRDGGSPADCSQDYFATETVSLRATPDSGHHFVGWNQACAAAGTNEVATVETTADLTCGALFEPLPPPPPPPPTGSTLTVQIVNGAAGRMVESQPLGIACTADAASDCMETYAIGTTVVLRATLQSFQSWQGCDEVMDINFCRVVMNQSRTVTATYSP